MSVDIYELARSANAMEKATGFISCAVVSETKRTLAFAFGTSQEANAFALARQVFGIKAVIPYDTPDVVVVTQP